jgi:hypothetical protein
MTAHSAVRAPAEGAWLGCGDATMAEVMLTMRPNFLARMPSMTARTRASGVQ